MSGAARRKLCIVTPAHWGAHTGGAEYQMRCLIEALAPLGRFEIFYLARLTGTSAAGPGEGYRLRRIGERRTPPRWGYLTDALPLYRLLREIAPDVIYQRVACGHTGIAAWYARRHRIPMIWHVAHDSDVTPVSVIDGRNPLRRWLEKSAIRYGIRHATHVVTQSRRQAGLLAHNYGRTAEAVIPNFQPVPAAEPVKPGPLSVAWVGTLKRWKQPDAFVRLAQACRDLEGVRFVLVGGGQESPAWHAELMRQIAATPNLEFRGPLPQEEVNELLAGAQLYVNTSLYEGFPNTFIQAWMRATPVVSLHVDPDDVLASAGLGLACGGDEQRLAAGVRGLLTDAARREAIGARARRYALQNHSLDNALVLGRLLAEAIAT